MIAIPTAVPGKAELVTPFEPREIRYAFHDIDGTHSLIRDWVPAMALTLGWVLEHGLPPDDPDAALRLMLAEVGRPFEEAHRFSIESAGLSALTQMEWAIRGALQNGKIRDVPFDRRINAGVIRRIWSGEELFDDCQEGASVKSLIREQSAALFRIYERILLAMSRDRNLESARKDPRPWRVPGSMEFLRYLRDCGVRNFFVTGAVVECDALGRPHGTMCEEVSALGYEIGPGLLLEGLEGSSWHEKQPKSQIMRNLCRRLEVLPEQILVVGDGRSEIGAGAAMGAVTLSRLPRSAVRARQIHAALHTNFIMAKYQMDAIRTILR